MRADAGRAGVRPRGRPAPRRRRAGCCGRSTPRSSSCPPPTGEACCAASSGAEGELLMRPEEHLAPEDARCVRPCRGRADRRCCSRDGARTHALDALPRARAGSRTPRRRRCAARPGVSVCSSSASGSATSARSTRTTVELLETFAGHASILLENGRLEHSLAEVTELKEQLRHQAYHDALTGLPNRRCNLVEAVETSSTRGTVDGCALPRPRPVQDRQRHLGSRAGDELLTKFSHRLARRDPSAGSRRPARWRRVRGAGPRSRRGHRVAVARRMLNAIAGTYVLERGDVACHVSLGIAVGAAARPPARTSSATRISRCTA